MSALREKIQEHIDGIPTGRLCKWLDYTDRVDTHDNLKAELRAHNELIARGKEAWLFQMAGDLVYRNAKGLKGDGKCDEFHVFRNIFHNVPVVVPLASIAKIEKRMTQSGIQERIDLHATILPFIKNGMHASDPESQVALVEALADAPERTHRGIVSGFNRMASTGLHRYDPQTFKNLVYVPSEQTAYLTDISVSTNGSRYWDSNSIVSILCTLYGYGRRIWLWPHDNTLMGSVKEYCRENGNKVLFRRLLEARSKLTEKYMNAVKAEGVETAEQLEFKNSMAFADYWNGIAKHKDAKMIKRTLAATPVTPKHTDAKIGSHVDRWTYARYQTLGN